MPSFVHSLSLLASGNVSIPVNPSLPEQAKEVIFTHYERKGVIVMSAAGVTSCVLISSLLLYIIFAALSPWPKRGPNSPIPFTSKQVSVFVICLLVSDLIQSISGVTQVKWAMERKIYEGKACSIQAATLVAGDLGSTVWSCVIAVHTFTSLALGKSWHRRTVIFTVITGWVIVFLLTTIPAVLPRTAGHGRYFSIAGTWCFISSEYAYQRLGIHYIPLFLAALVIFVFYGMVFLVLRGTLSFNGRKILQSRNRAEQVFIRERIVIAKRMLWYPIAYLACIMPIAIIRLVGLSEDTIPDPVWVFAMFFLFSLGTVDAIIYTTTRNLIKPLGLLSHVRTGSSELSSTKTQGSIIRNGTQKSTFYQGSKATELDEISKISHKSKSQGNGPPMPQTTTVHITLQVERVEELI
ncbi:hypothetical protein M422DRAFT_246963 [Sphaerobolus stellatus SS14]|nr:hypothetical protein M422DRAFT_246963 [Sphaerobolus stellatus SS14]